MADNNYVPNEVFKFRVAFEGSKEITVYVKPFPEDLSFANDFWCYWEMERRTNLVQSKYFTKERIEKLKEEFIKKIRESENPFNISCVDTDSGYRVTEEQLFDLEQP